MCRAAPPLIFVKCKMVTIREMNDDSSPYLAMPPRLLRNACRDAGRDDHGRACVTCQLHDLCERQNLDVVSARSHGGTSIAA